MYDRIRFVRYDIVRRTKWNPISVFERFGVRLFCLRFIEEEIWWYSSMWRGKGFDR